MLSFNHGDLFLATPFSPSDISMDAETGRVYHPAADKVGGVGLIADKLSIAWTQVREKRNMQFPDSTFVAYIHMDCFFCE